MATSRTVTERAGRYRGDEAQRGIEGYRVSSNGSVP